VISSLEGLDQHVVCVQIYIFIILNLGVYILLRVLDQVEGCPSNATLFQ
jgi:hypothetical protein